MMEINPIALAIYVRVLTANISLADCIKMRDQMAKGVRPDTFKGMGLENLSLDDCKELIRMVINSKKNEKPDDNERWNEARKDWEKWKTI